MDEQPNNVLKRLCWLIRKVEAELDYNRALVRSWETLYQQELDGIAKDAKEVVIAAAARKLIENFGVSTWSEAEAQARREYERRHYGNS